jgi:hypothetical protein
MKFNLYVGHTLRYEGVGFNHATGWVYRAQGFGAPDRDDYVSVFEVQAALRDGFARIGRTCAIEQSDLYVVRNAKGEALSRPLPKITAEHFLAEIDWAAKGHQTNPPCYIGPCVP